MTKISLNVSVADSRITSFHLSENRLKRIMSGDKEQALYMGFWDRTAEFFRSEKKADVLAQLWTMMYPTDNSSAPVSKLDKFKVQMDAFQSLVSMVDEEAVKKLNNNVNPFSFTANSDVNTDNINFTFFLKGEPFKVITLNRNDFDGEVSGLNFRGGKFEDLDFSGMDFKDIDFTECIFSRVNVSNCKFTNCPISRVKFLDSTGKGASFQYGIETSADIGVIEKSMPQYICRDADFSTLSGPVTFHKTIFLNSEVLDINTKVSPDDHNYDFECSKIFCFKNRPQQPRLPGDDRWIMSPIQDNLESLLPKDESDVTIIEYIMGSS